MEKGKKDEREGRKGKGFKKIVKEISGNRAFFKWKGDQEFEGTGRDRKRRDTKGLPCSVYMHEFP